MLAKSKGKHRNEKIFDFFLDTLFCHLKSTGLKPIFFIILNLFLCLPALAQERLDIFTLSGQYG